MSTADVSAPQRATLRSSGAARDDSSRSRTRTLTLDAWHARQRFEGASKTRARASARLDRFTREVPDLGHDQLLHGEADGAARARDHEDHAPLDEPCGRP